MPVGVDLFELDGKDYMFTVDYFSNFLEIDTLENIKSSTLIKKKNLTAHFAQYGLPCVVVSDNGPQFTSTNFENFSRNYDFEHQTSSLYSSKSNGKAESAVKTAQKTQVLLRKNRDGDQFLALLNYRNAPNQARGTSSGQRFLNQRTWTLLPTTKKFPKPKVSPELEKEWLQLNQKKQKKNFDKHVKDYTPLEEGDTAKMKTITLSDKWLDMTGSVEGRFYCIRIIQIFCG